MRITLLICAVAFVVPALAVGQAVTILPATTMPVTSQPAMNSRLENARQMIQDMLALPVLPPMKETDVISIRSDASGTVVATKVPDTHEGEARLPLIGTQAFARVLCEWGESAPPANTFSTPKNFHLIVFRSDVPGTEKQLEVFFTPTAGSFQMAYTVESEKDLFTVQLIQLPHVMGDANNVDESLRLMVQRLDNESGNKSEDLNLTAPDFVQLRRRYPAETTRYLRPLFAELGTEAPLFTADPKVAWQVLGTGASVNAAIRERIKEILPKLDADAFATREAAQKALQDLGQPAAQALRAYDRSTFTFQQNAEVDAFLASFSPISAEEAAKLDTSPDFLTDCLELPDKEIRRLAWDRLKRLVPNVPAFDPFAPEEVRSVTLATLRSHLLPPATQPSK